jgi:hypothetical protein
VSPVALPAASRSLVVPGKHWPVLDFPDVSHPISANYADIMARILLLEHQGLIEGKWGVSARK